ncbi:MAG: DUF1667 domain-containing protein [Lachnospiraceae bacterium]|nr:DUF1667 domain-containing protein [Lachnospiraceae bacterium]
MTEELTCIRCPIGCALTVTIDGDNVTVTGNSCPRGAEYGAKEVTDPTRIVTSSVRVINGAQPLVSVKTASDIPKDKIFAVMEEIHKCKASAPISIGDVIITDVAHTGVDIVATRMVTAV